MHTKKEIQEWLILQVADLLQIDPSSVDINETFSAYGFSSLEAVTLSGDLEEFLGRPISPTIAYEYSSITALTAYLAGDAKNALPEPDALPLGHATEPIAVIGLSCRFPGANNTEAFWQLLKEGVDAITEIPNDRWNKDAFYHPDATVPGKSISRWGGFLDNIDQFDPFFFGISPAEATYMDPQQRLLLELSYEALDDAGQKVKELEGSKTGVFVGISANEYSQLQTGNPLQLTSHSGTGISLSIAANRISYFYNLHGPSLAIDTACSSSLTAVHLACQSLRRGECKLALAGGVNLVLSPAHSIAFTKAGVLSPDGRCKTFDSGANGYVRGEGGGVVILKPLSTALKDGDPVQAVILGSAMAQDGRTNGLMAPSAEAQELLLREAYKAADVLPGTVQYVEAHGTGTVLGDAMEAQAIGAVVGAHRAGKPCAVGSVKTNLGHLESAAGMAGLIKVILSLKHRTIPPSLHYHTPNPHISFHKLNLQVNHKLTPWHSVSGSRLAGVSSFGFGGTNVHLVVREADKYVANEEEKESVTDVGEYLLPLSANSQQQLRSLAADIRKSILSEVSASAKDISYAAAKRRSLFLHRLVVLGRSCEDFSNGLDAFLSGEREPNLFTGSDVPKEPPKLAFVFSGQGGQWFGMGRELLKQEPVFGEAIAQIDSLIQSHFLWSVLEVIGAEEQEQGFDNIEFVQPTLFAIQVALAVLWQSWGIKPDAVVGHSMGEIAAAHVAGVLSLEDAVQIVCRRSQLLKQFRGQGCMLATELSPVEAAVFLKEYSDQVSIAVINSPASTVLSGDIETIEIIKRLLEGQHRFCKLVNVDVASHSPQMEGLRTELLEVLSGLEPQAPQIPIYSTVTGSKRDGLSFAADYWMDNLRKPVLFSDAIDQMLQDEYSVFIEISPHPVLLGSIQQTMQAHGADGRLFPSLRRQEPERKALLETLASLYTEGYTINWDKLYKTKGKHVRLPLQPWQRQRYWIDAPLPILTNVGCSTQDHHPLLGVRLNLANSPSSFVWQTSFENAVLHFLRDHMVENEVLFPAAGYMEMALQCAREAALTNAYLLCHFSFQNRMTLDKSRVIQTHFSPDDEGGFVFQVYSRVAEDENWVLHAAAKFQRQPAKGSQHLAAFEANELCRESELQYTTESIYQRLKGQGLFYGPSFQGIEQTWSKGNEAIGLVRLPEALQYESKFYQIHPALLDACLQVIAATQNVSVDYSRYIPTGCETIRFYARPGHCVWSHTVLISSPDSMAGILIADIRLFNNSGEQVAELTGFRLQRTSEPKPQISSEQQTWLYHQRWQQEPRQSTLPGSALKGKHWLILADGAGVGEELAQQIEASGGHCHLIYWGEIMNVTTMAPEVSFSEHMEKRLNEISSPLDGVVHLWSLSTTTPPANNFNCNQSNDFVLESALLLIQALVKRITGLPRLWLVTSGAQQVRAGEPVAVEQSALWGLGKVIHFELPEAACTRIDLDPLQSVIESANLLISEFSRTDQEDEIAYRAGLRYVHRLMPFTRKISAQVQAPKFIGNATYMITGGFGALGLKTAEWMAQHGARHLVLMGRSEPSLNAQRKAEQLQQQGVEVVIAKGDVSHWDDVQQVVETIKKEMPVLRGIIHAAGILDDGALMNLNGERLRKVMAPKVAGTWNLHHVTAGLLLDFFVLFSSAVSVLGSPGQGNYAAASAVLDAFAHYRYSLGLPAISINWGPWADIGLAAEATERLTEQNASTAHLIKVIQIEEGLTVLGQLLTAATPQVMVLPFDLKNLVALYPAAAGMPFLADVGGSDMHTSRLYARPKLRQPYVAPDNEIERKLVQLWQQTLHIDRVGVHDSFFELGGDSVLAAQVLTAAHKTFGIRINPQDAFRAFTIKRLAELLETHMLQKIEAMSEEEVRQLLAEGKSYAE